jgi:acetyltransferase-like isoleucine patch superfamily enzyme/lysophospholipase L1-like esterase
VAGIPARRHRPRLEWDDCGMASSADTGVDLPSVTAERLRAQFGEAVEIGRECDIAPAVLIELDPGAALVIGDRVCIRRGTTIQVHRGATILIGNDVAIGENVFISAMVGIRLGDGCALSNMVDLHDHNHRERSQAHAPDADLVPWAGGFEGAPIVVEPGALISNKVSITGGVRVGHNALVTANSVVTRSVVPDSIAAGVPAASLRSFEGAPVPVIEDRRTLAFGWFGTSIMEHLEGFNAQMFNQADLPEVGSAVTVESWRSRGYVQRLHLGLQAAWPHLTFEVDNRGEGGATSRDISGIVERAAAEGRRYDVAFLGCGINDVWRGFQGRTSEAVGRDEYARNYAGMLATLTLMARHVICIVETPFGPIEEPDTVVAMNAELAAYNVLAASAAQDAGALFLDVWGPFTTAARHLASAAPGNPAHGQSLWSDGVHLSELGDALMLRQIEAFLAAHCIIQNVVDYPRMERSEALSRYRPMFTAQRQDTANA